MRRQVIDQAAHVLIGFMILAPAALWPGPVSFAVSGAAIGLVREVTEGWPVFTPGSLLDVLFWSLGGLTCWAAFAA